MGKSDKSQERQCYCRGCLRDSLGDELFEYTQAVARAAPAPSPEAIDRARRLFAPAAARIREQQAAGTYVPSVCPRPNCECGRSAESSQPDP